MDGTDMYGLMIAMMGLIFSLNMFQLKKIFDINERLAKLEAKIKYRR